MNTKRIYTLFLSFATLVGFGSCTLEEDPEYFVGKGEFYKSKEQCVTAINSCYTRLSSIYSFKMMTLTDAHSDIIYEPAPTVTEARMELSPAQPGHGETIWQYCYQMIMYANAACAGIEGSPLDEDVKKELLAEAVVLRAFYYNLLTSFFNDVPFYRDNVNTPEVMDKISRLPRMSAVETRRSLIEEVQEYLPVMPALRTSEVEGNRAGKALALMLIGKMAMWNAVQDEAAESPTYWYDVALGALTELEGIYGELSQYPLEDIKFRYKNTPESIFEVQHSYTPGGLIYTSNLACICMPYQYTEERGTNVFDGVEITEIGSDANVWTPARPNLFFCAGMQTETGGDLRATINMAWEYNGDRFGNVNTRPWLGPKFWCPNMRDGYDSNNYKIYRYADAVLMMAECYHAKGDYSKAVEYLNKVRSRAGLADYTFRNAEKLLNEIQNERGCELFGEFQRKFDLVRWGIWFERVSEINDYQQLRDNVRPCHEYLPIPDKQVIYSGFALDNKEYNKYGM